MINRRKIKDVPVSSPRQAALEMFCEFFKAEIEAVMGTSDHHEVVQLFNYCSKTVADLHEELKELRLKNQLKETRGFVANEFAPMLVQSKIVLEPDEFVTLKESDEEFPEDDVPHWDREEDL